MKTKSLVESMMQVLASLSGWHPQLSAAELKALLPHTEITSTSSPRIVGLHSLENQERPRPKDRIETRSLARKTAGTGR